MDRSSSIVHFEDQAVVCVFSIPVAIYPCFQVIYALVERVTQSKSTILLVFPFVTVYFHHFLSA